MNKTEKLILSVVDEDIAENFEGSEDGSFALYLPLQIHLCRHLKIIAEKLTSVRKARDDNSGNCSNGSGSD